MSNDMKGAPVTLYLDGKSVTIHQIDAPAWRENGWGDDPETVTPVVEEIAEGAGEKDQSEGSSDVPAPAPKKGAKA